MAEFYLGVDILVRQIHAAAERHLAVHNQHFPVVPVVDGSFQIEHGVKGEAVDPQIPQLHHVQHGIGGDTAQVVIHDPHIHALGSFPCHNLHHGVPHGAVFNNEILHIDRFPGAFQGGEHILVHVLSQRIVGCPLTGHHRESRLLLYPAEGLGQPGVDPLKLRILRSLRCRHMLLCLLQLLTDGLPAPFIADAQIQHRPRHREGKDDDQPEHPVSPLVPAGKDIQLQYHREHGQSPGQNRGIGRQPAEQEPDPQPLHDDGRQNRQNMADHFFHSVLPLCYCQADKNPI